MRSKYMNLAYFSAFTMSVVMGFTTPTLNLYFMSIIDKNSYVAATIIMTLLAAIGQTLMSKENLRSILSKWLLPIIAVDSTLFIIVSMYSVDYPSFRFIGMAVLTGINNVIISTLFMELVNSKFAGKELTTFRSKQSSCALWGSVIGCTLAFMVTMDVTTCIYIQCSLFSIDVLVDKYKVKYLNNIEC